MAGAVYATQIDVSDIWQPIPADQVQQVNNLLIKASARLRQSCPFDIDQRIAYYAADPSDPRGLNPLVVADVTANIVKRVLVNPLGAMSRSEAVGPYSHSETFAGRYSSIGTGDLGALYVSADDVNALRPANKAALAKTIHVTPGKETHQLSDGDPWKHRRELFGWPLR